MMASGTAIERWLARVRHDLVKRLLWPARDRRDAGGTPAPGELAPRLVDDEGQPTDAGALWRRLASDAPSGLELSAFEAAVSRATAAAEAGDVEGVLALEPAFAALGALARSLDGSRGRMPS
jgi:hypothetical protein